MDPSLVWEMILTAATPALFAGVFWVTRRDMRRTIIVFSALALGVGLASDSIYTALLKSAASGQGVFLYGPLPFELTSPLLSTLQLWRGFVLGVAWALQSAAWILALYDAIHARRGRWLVLVLVCATLVTPLAYFAGNLFSLSYLAGFAPLTLLLILHPFASLFTITALSLIAAGATLLYAQVGVRVATREARANGLVPGAVRAPTREARAAVLQADEALEDVVFVVEDVPRGQG